MSSRARKKLLQQPRRLGPMLPLGFSIIVAMLFLGLLTSALVWLPSQLVSAQTGGAQAVAQFYRDGVVGSEVKAGGSVDIPDANEWKPSAAMTIELWAKPRRNYSASQDVAPHLISKQGPGYKGYALIYEDRVGAMAENGALKGCIGLGSRWECVSGNAASRASLVSATWYHVALVKSSGVNGRLQLYLNGSKIGDVPSRATISSGTSMLRLGGYSLLPARYAFDGDLDEVRIYSSAMGADDVNRHYTSERATIGVSSIAVSPTQCNRGSAFSADYECAKAHPGVAGEWATLGNANPWIQQTFVPAVTVGRIVLKDRVNTSDNVLQGVVEFSDGQRISFTRLDPTGSGFLIPVVPIKRNVSSMKVIIDGKQGPNIGLAEFAVYPMLPGSAEGSVLGEAELLRIASEGNVFGFSRSEGCEPGAMPAIDRPCLGQAYYGWIWMNCFGSINNEGAPADYCPVEPATGQKVQARVLVCPMDDRGRTPTLYASISASSRLRDCIGKNQGEIVGYAWGGGLSE